MYCTTYALTYFRASGTPPEWQPVSPSLWNCLQCPLWNTAYGGRLTLRHGRSRNTEERISFPVSEGCWETWSTRRCHRKTWGNVNESNWCPLQCALETWLKTWSILEMGSWVCTKQNAGIWKMWNKLHSKPQQTNIFLSNSSGGYEEIVT